MSIWEAKYKYTYINNGKWTDYIMYYLLWSWCVVPFNILVWSCDLTVKLVVKLIRAIRRLVED